MRRTFILFFVILALCLSVWAQNEPAERTLIPSQPVERERPAAAPRAAQVEMWKQKQWQSPYYWAAFTMQGEWR